MRYTFFAKMVNGYNALTILQKEISSELFDGS